MKGKPEVNEIKPGWHLYSCWVEVHWKKTGYGISGKDSLFADKVRVMGATFYAKRRPVERQPKKTRKA
jgi:hypothetical protein